MQVMPVMQVEECEARRNPENEVTREQHDFKTFKPSRRHALTPFTKYSDFSPYYSIILS
jgi:hypothetical protein